MKIITKVDSIAVRNMCIAHNYYTRGDNKAYSKMLNKYDDKTITGKSLRSLAEDILTHSSTKDSLLEIANNIMDEATCTFAVFKD